LVPMLCSVLCVLLLSIYRTVSTFSCPHSLISCYSC
jgi:hypothetical protein